MIWFHFWPLRRFRVGVLLRRFPPVSIHSLSARLRSLLFPLETKLGNNISNNNNDDDDDDDIAINNSSKSRSGSSRPLSNVAAERNSLSLFYFDHFGGAQPQQQQQRRYRRSSPTLVGGIGLVDKGGWTNQSARTAS